MIIIKDFDSRVDFNTSYFFIVGSYSLIFLYFANIFWNVAAERQIKKLRYFILRIFSIK